MFYTTVVTGGSQCASFSLYWMGLNAFTDGKGGTVMPELYVPPRMILGFYSFHGCQ